MIDWLELDLHRTLQCAAGNYFVLETGGSERERQRQRDRWGRERETERGREGGRANGRLIASSRAGLM